MTDEVMDKLAERALANNPPAPGDYRGEDGLLRCGVCGDPKETIIAERVVACACRCRQEAGEKLEREKREAENEERRKKAFTSPKLAGYRLSKADPGETTEKISRYVSEWARFKEEGSGLLLWGSVGTGKSFYSACIVNAIIDKGESARMRTAGEVVIEAQDAENKMRYINNLCDKSLLVLDDLGAERGTSFGAEIIYTLIDKRYQSGKPLIVTTNIPLQDMKNTDDAGKLRLYDRILEVCIPVKVTGESRRKRKAAERLESARKALASAEG